MSKFTVWIRKYIGLIISMFGIILLAILIYGDLGELFTEQYWKNVGGNLSSIGALSIGLVMIQTSIKQGISEQALSAGLNTENTKKKYTEHKEHLSKNKEKEVYLPYFLSMRNDRETKQRKREFLLDNDFTSERGLKGWTYVGKNKIKRFFFNARKKKLISRYDKIKVNITTNSIKWSTTDITYTKNGSIEKLDAYRKKRALSGFFTGLLFMFGAAFITGGLFLDVAEIPFWQKTVKLFVYLFVIGITVITDIGKNYEKGAFGVPNELEEINGIWVEFENWEVPEWVIKEVEKNEKSQSHMVMLDADVLKLPAPQEIKTEIIEVKEEKVDERESAVDSRATIQEESEKIEDI